MPRIQADNLDAHRELIRTRLVEAFTGVVRERGYAGTSLAEVAQRAGIARNTVYNYVPDKVGLLVACVEEEVAAFLAAVEAEQGGTTTPARRLRVVLRRLLGTLADEPQGAFALADGVAPFPVPADRRVEEAFQPLFDLVRGLLQDGVAAGELRPVADPALVVDLMMGVVAVARRSLLEPGAAVERITDETVEFLLRAVTAPPGGAATP